MNDIEETRQYLKEVYARSVSLGIEDVRVDNFRYRVCDEKIILLDYFGEEEEKLVVPDWFDEIAGYLTEERENEIECHEVRPALKEIVFGERLKAVHAYAFATMEYLRKITAPGVEIVYDFGFYCHQSIETIEMVNLREVGCHAFELCTQLRSITLNKVERIHHRGFTNAGLTSVNLPSLKDCDTEVFADNYNLTRATLPRHRIKGGAYMFMNCQRLLEVKNTEYLDLIPAGMFSHCEKLYQVNLRASFVAISAFCRCTNLKFIRIYNELVEVDGTKLDTRTNGGIYNDRLPIATFKQLIQREHKTIYQQHIENIKKGKLPW